MTPGTRVITPSQRTGIVLKPPWRMLYHRLIQFDDGQILWILDELLSPLPQDWGPIKKTRKKKEIEAWPF